MKIELTKKQAEKLFQDLILQLKDDYEPIIIDIPIKENSDQERG